MSSTDYLRLNEHKIFRELCDSLPKNISKTLNIVVVHDSLLFAWDFQNNCVLTLNIKAARSRAGDNVIHQKLLPLHPPLFSPETLRVNESGTLLAVSGSNGILVLQLPTRFPPYGAFDNNKEVVYCRSHSLDERLLACNDSIEVRQVKFHPGSFNHSHILALTSDNMLRLYQIKEDEALNVTVIPVGEKPSTMFPGSKTPFLDCFGETAMDFDFGHPEASTLPPTSDHEDFNKSVSSSGNTRTEDRFMINAETQTIEKIVPKEKPIAVKNKEKEALKMLWPVYILRGDSTVYSLTIDLNKRAKPQLKGPLAQSGFDYEENDACSVVLLNTVPQIVIIAVSNGTIYHSLLLDNEDEDLEKRESFNCEGVSKELIAFETVELELGISSGEEVLTGYKCPIFLHQDDSKPGRYYATHSTGVHSVNISCVDDLRSFANGSDDVNPTSDLFASPSNVEYLVCTKATTSQKTNPVIGFSPYHEPSSVITLLSDGSLVTLGVVFTSSLPNMENLTIVEDDDAHSPLKRMLKEPFDVYIQKILKKTSTQPVLKLSSTGEPTQEQCYELLQRTAQVFRNDYFKHHTKVREELEKRVQALTMMKNDQQKELKRMMKEREVLQDKASNLAEKYEDIKDKQDEILKKCEELLKLVSRKKSEPSDAEKQFMEEIQNANEKSVAFGNRIDKLKSKMKYQEIQMENWKAQEINKVSSSINESHCNTIRASLEESTKKITQMIKDINEFKKLLNLK